MVEKVPLGGTYNRRRIAQSTWDAGLVEGGGEGGEGRGSLDITAKKEAHAGRGPTGYTEYLLFAGGK